MRTWRSFGLTILLTVLVSTGGAACRDDEPDGDGDGDADSDADGDADSDADADTDADGEIERIPCPDVVLCVDECGDDDDCALDCARRICGPAAEELGDLLTCTANNCGAASCSDRESPECQSCIVEHCAAYTLDCYTSSCVPGEQSCGEVSVCLAGCGTDDDCADGCADTICPAGSDELDALMTCLDGSCETECTNRGAPACGTCIQEHCGEQMNSCLWAPCT